MTNQRDDVRKNESTNPAVSIQPVGEPIPIVIENIRPDASESTDTESNPAGQQNQTSSGDLK